jgi:hypothetical protein
MEEGTRARAFMLYMGVVTFMLYMGVVTSRPCVRATMCSCTNSTSMLSIES